MIGATKKVANWVLPSKVDKRAVGRFTTKLNLPEQIAQLLALRGHTTLDGAKLFLRPRLENLHDAAHMSDMDIAVDRILRAIKERETIMIHGDYDVDGICSTTLLVKTIRVLGGVAIPFIPNRMSDGYDLGSAGVRQAVRLKASVVITCDCGTSAVDPVDELNEAGIDAVIIDHHLPGGSLPEAHAILNPRKLTCEYPDKDLAAVGVVFKFCLALSQAMETPDAFVWKMIDLVALATIADIAPLNGENRIFVKYGLRMMAETQNIGLQALIRSSGMEGKTITCGRVGFTLAPRLNAVGRIGSALKGVELLLSDSRSHANRLARELEELNHQRQNMDRAALYEAREMVEELPLDDTFGIVLASQHWHPGVIGIVASRLVEDYGRPVFLISVEGETGKGSGRSIPGFNLHESLEQSKELLVKYGGHKGAAGLTIDVSRIDEFAAHFNELARKSLTEEDLLPQIRIDGELHIDDATDEFETLLRYFEPFGVGNPTPVFVARNVSLAAPPRVVGRDSLKLQLATSNGSLDAIGWGMGSYVDILDVQSRIDIAYKLERDEYRGYNKLQAKLCAIEIK